MYLFPRVFAGIPFFVVMVSAAFLFSSCSDSVSTPNTTGSFVAVGGNAGSVAIGSDAAIFASFENKGTSDATITSLTITPADAQFTILTPTSFPVTVNAGAKQTFQVRYRPTVAGTHSTGLKIGNSIRDTTVNLTGTGTTSASGGIIIVTGGNAGTVTVGGEGEITASVENKGTTDATITSIALIPSDPQFTLVSPTAFPLTVKAGAKQDIVVRYRPSAVGTHSVGLRVGNSLKDTIVNLSGTGAISSSGGIIATGGSTGTVVIGNEATITASITNLGSNDVSLSALTFEPANPQFSVISPTSLPVALKTGIKQTIEIKFRPTIPGTQSVGLKFSNSFKDTIVILTGSAETNPADAVGFSITINGGGMVNRKISFGIPGASATGSSIGLYSNTEKSTAVAVTDKTFQVNGQDVEVAIIFPGKTAATFPFSTSGMKINFKIGNPASTGELFTSGTEGTLVINNYGQIGERISATFSGKMDYIHGSGNPLQVVDVTGSFECFRLPDQ